MSVIPAHVPRYGALADGYPAVKYHLDGRAVVVQTDHQDAALGPGWFNTPDPEKQIAYLLHVGRQGRAWAPALPANIVTEPVLDHSVLPRKRGRPRKVDVQVAP